MNQTELELLYKYVTLTMNQAENYKEIYEFNNYNSEDKAFDSPLSDLEIQSLKILHSDLKLQIDTPIEHLYLISDKKFGLLAINTSVDVKKTRGELQSRTSSRLQILAIREGEGHLKEEAYKKFSNERVLNSEWFNDCEEIRAYFYLD